MQQHTLGTVVQENSHSVYGLSAQMLQLEVVQGAVARLMERIDDITNKGWHEDSGLAYLSILEIQDTVRLIDMAFLPLFQKIEGEVDTINTYAQELHDTVINGQAEKAIINS